MGDNTGVVLGLVVRGPGGGVLGTSVPGPGAIVGQCFTCFFFGTLFLAAVLTV